MKILITTDGSSHSEKAVETALQFAFPSGSEIKIISVTETPPPVTLDVYGSSLIQPSAKLEQVARENALQILENSRKKLLENFKSANIKIMTEVLYGTPESEIVEAAKKMNADLIIVGSHGYNTLERLFLGSVSDAVVHHAPCSVLVVRNAKD